MIDLQQELEIYKLISWMKLPAGVRRYLPKHVELSGGGESYKLINIVDSEGLYL